MPTISVWLADLINVRFLESKRRWKQRLKTVNFSSDFSSDFSLVVSRCMSKNEKVRLKTLNKYKKSRRQSEHSSFIE